MKLLTLTILSIMVPVAVAQQAPKRLYIEERLVTHAGTNVHCDESGNCYGQDSTHTRNVSLEATRAFASGCAAVMITDNRENADFVLRISPGNSTVYAKNGDVAYISPAKIKLGNVVKDVCKFLGAH